MTILLDIDGVLVTTPTWRKTEFDVDGFLKFNERAGRNLFRIVNETNADIVLTSTHRINYPVEKWKIIFQSRGINPNSISLLNDVTTVSDMLDRAAEIKEWVEKQKGLTKYVVIDDDLSINGLPNSIKEKCVLTKPLIGLDEEAMYKVMSILKGT
jgi:hypothetical protein